MFSLVDVIPVAGEIGSLTSGTKVPTAASMVEAVCHAAEESNG